MSQEPSQTQEDEIKQKLINVTTEKILKHEDKLIAEKLRRELRKLIRQNENEEDEEKLEPDQILETMEDILWHIVKMFAVLRNGGKAELYRFFDTYGYEAEDMTLCIDYVEKHYGEVEIISPSNSTVGYLKIDYELVRRKGVYELANEYYNKWDNILRMIFDLNKEMNLDS